MRKIVSLIVAGTLTFGLASMPVVGQEAQQIEVSDPTPVIAEVGQRYILKSGVLGEDREVLVRVPAGYDAEDVSTRYPVIFTLDGERHFDHPHLAAGILEGTDRIPESIIVAIPNNPGMRGRDLAREMDKFIRFIGEELFVFIDSRYRTSGQKTLFGHSLAGYFTLSVLADHPDMFDTYIAASPAVHARRGEVVKKLEQLFSDNAEISKSLYFTLGDEADEGQRLSDTTKQLVAMLEKSAPASLDWKYEYIPAQVHMTTPYLTMYQGLSHVFNDYQAPGFVTVKAYDDFGGMSALKAYFAKRAAKYNKEEGLPQDVLRALGYLHSGEGMHEQAIALFKQNAETYPYRPRVYNSLGDGYNAAGQLDKAIEAHQRAVKVAEEQDDEDIAWFRRNLQRLEQKIADQ